MPKRLVRNGEVLAMEPDAIRSGQHAGRHAIWWDYGPRVRPNCREGSLAVVTILGSLEHHACGYGDSYEDILERVRCAMTGEDTVQEARRRAWYDDSVEIPDPEPPKAVVLRLDSPGGVVSGLNETVRCIRRMSKEHGIPVYAYVDELAASAAYALACSASEIYIPRSGICGSIGVISTMYDQVAADKKMGVNFVTLTSGKRKADGHPHVPVSDEARAAEQGRVDKMARDFFRLVSKARGISPSEVASFEAGIFLGKDARRAGLADAVMSWREFVAYAENVEPQSDGTPPTGVGVPRNGSGARNKLAKRANGLAHSGTSNGTPAENPPMNIAALLAKLAERESKIVAQVAKATDAGKKASLTKKLTAVRAEIEAAKKVKHTVEKYEEESDEGDEDSEEDDEEESKGNETDRKEDDDGDDADDDDGDDEDDDEEEDDEEDEEEESEESSEKAAAEALRLVARVTGSKGKRMVGALQGLIDKANRYDGLAADVRAIKAERRKERKAAVISKALHERKITPHEAKQLKAKPLSFVEGMISMRKSAIVVDDEGVRIADRNAGPGAELSQELLREIDRAVACAPDGADPDKLRKSMIDAHQKRMAAAANGAAGRY